MHAPKFGGRHPLVSVNSATLSPIGYSRLVAARVQIVVSYHFLRFVREGMEFTAIDFFFFISAPHLPLLLLSLSLPNTNVHRVTFC